MAARAAARTATRAARGAGAGAEAGSGAGAKKQITRKPNRNTTSPRTPEKVSPMLISTWDGLRYPTTTKPIQGKVRETGSRASGGSCPS
ncbi:hypothetical protein ACJ72_00115 [Emergomyces africanus]|uniref:Uncharacterized protein n=1 Tax=Emergomyces africanus TaxID=1955775 RepID=A0A1B7P905_9EURO|nr:hypothetical protein ACJ72_00115 [Emergomyces africanus]